jgi:hypothetical protein
VKRVVIIVAAVIVFAVVAWDAIEFSGGYNAFPIILGFLPASFFLFALTSLTTCVATVLVLVALVRHRIRYASILALVVAVGWLFSPWFLARSAFLLGLGTHLHQSSSPSEIQSVAQTCLSLMPNGGTIFGPRKVMGSRPEEAEQSQRAWNEISSHSFVHLDRDTCVIFVKPPEVSFTWGGALPGHWGILVGGPSDPTPSFYHQTIRFADSIVLFRGE